MALLVSEDNECVSSVDLRPFAGSLGEEHPGQVWQRFELTMKSGMREFSEQCLLCRQPEDEAGKLVLLIGELVDGKRNEVIFEPAEPTFELSLSRTREGGIKAEVWIDSGNASTGFYRWDACGIRFYTTDANLKSFAESLLAELPACSAQA
jgi:hypothetical protein